MAYPTWSGLLSMPIKEQAKYADGICVRHAFDRAFLADALSEGNHFEDWNRTSVGNMAFVALYSPAPYNDKARARLRRFIAWKLRQIYE